MGMAEFERRKDEKIDGVFYDMSPSPILPTESSAIISTEL